MGWLIGIGSVMAGIEVGLIFALRASASRDVQWPVKFMAVLAAVLLAAGVGRHYWDIWTHRTVRGISFIFVGIDAAGDLFSLVSVFFQADLNVLGMAIYGTELALWIGVFVCGGFFNFTPWVRARLSRRRVRGEGREVRAQESEQSGIATHHMPSSSTSVFRTPSAGMVERSRAGG